MFKSAPLLALLLACSGPAAAQLPPRDQSRIDPTRANVAAVVRRMESDGPGEERQNLIRIAGDLHADLGRAGDKAAQRDVQKALSRLAKNEPDPKVRKAAVLTYSRLGWFPDSLPLLASARPVLGDQPYHQELAHLLLSAPADEQLKIIQELDVGEGHNNELGKQILANLLRDELAMKRLAPAAVRPMLALMQKQEPVFGAPPEAMGATTIGAYADWFNAVVALTTQSTGEASHSVIARMLKLDGDPRKLVAVFDDEHSAAIARPALALRDREKVDAILAAFAARYRSNPNVQGFVRQARRNLPEPRAAKQ